MHTRTQIKTARLISASIFLIFTSVNFSANSQIEFEEDFVDPAPTEHKWNFCQLAEKLNESRPGQNGQPRSAYRLGINASWDEPKCKCNRRSGCASMTAEEAKYYGPDDDTDEETPLIIINFLPQSQIQKLKEKVTGQCDGYNEKPALMKGSKKVQKNELRLWSEDWSAAVTGHWFSFRFKIDGKIGACGSRRWVGGQFKARNMDNSPFIAQRFDNGVFHITIEAPHHTELKYERIIVAKASGHPDLTPEHFIKGSKATVTCDYSTGRPEPKSCGFAGQVKTYGKNLPPTKDGDWIQMDYYVRITGPCECCKPRKCPRLLEVWADGEKIAEVTGRFGAVKAHESVLKFKFGVYRDRQAGNAGIIIDDFSIRSDPNKKWSPKQRSTGNE